jgi:hypothetical protein
MKKALVLGAAIALLGLGGAVAFFVPKPSGGAAPPADLRPVWRETAWPFPMDQWGTGKAFTCAAADCGVQVNLYVRAKIGFCNCATGVSDDEELDRVNDIALIAAKYAPLDAGRPIAVAWMKGRSRSYAPVDGAGPALGVAFNDRCDVIAATFVGSEHLNAWEPKVLAFLNSDPVLRWAEKTLGL